MDKRRRQLTLYDPAVFRGSNPTDEERKIGVAAPKMFAFDGVFDHEDSQEDVCQAGLSDVIAGVVGGSDGCLFCFGHANLGKTRSMLGSDQCAADMGAIPVAVAWLYRAVKERKARTGARFSVRVSALEIVGQREEVRDLLAPYETENDAMQSPAVYLRHLPGGGSSILQNQSELRASSAEKAAHYLDAALAGRSLDSQGRESHLLFTLHVYQYSADGGASGRSRLHLIDFGGCERTRSPHGGITLSGLGNVILGIFGGQKHLPHRDSKVTKVLRECLGSLQCQATMLAHVSPDPAHYSETLHTSQLASRLHRMRRKRMKASCGSGSGSSDERRLSKFRSRSAGSGGRTSSSDLTSGTSTAYSSSEMSCDTVVYRGASDGSGTDCENPPVFLPALRSLVSSSGGSSAPGSLRGSLDEIPRPRRPRTAGSKILTNGAISPRRTLSPQPPNRSLSNLPVIHEVNTNSRTKMPLNGLVPVPGRRQQAAVQQQKREEQWVDVMPRRLSQEQWVDQQHQSRAYVHQQQQQQHHHQQYLQQPHQFPHQQQHQPYQQQHQHHTQHPHQHPNQQQQHPRYGYMDSHKANMIHSWVENQVSAEEPQSFHALTQFKTCDMELELRQQQQQHQVLPEVDRRSQPLRRTQSTNSSRPVAPPLPPPRRTPPRDTLSALVDECNILASKFNSREHPMRPEDPRDLRPEDNRDHPLRPQDSRNHPLKPNDHALRPEDSRDHPLRPDEDSREHPLRILSEENLTVVSSFAGSANDLNVEVPDEDPSNLSFFEVPDFESMKDDMEQEDNFISERFKELAQVERNIEPSPEKEELPPLNNNNNVEATTPVLPPPPQDLSPPFPTQDLSPQKQFQLLAQSLRHPDGSSNPELNVIMVDNSKRSPGNGQSSSDVEDNVEAPKTEQREENGNEEVIMKPKKEKFGSRLLRLFGSQRKLNKKSERSKSCERNSNQEKIDWATHSRFNVGIRAASSSPSIQQSSNKIVDSSSAYVMPSTLSIATEWEYQQQKAKPRLFSFKKPDRKSSGYDSLGGDESSSQNSNSSSLGLTPSPAAAGADHTLMLKQKLMQCSSDGDESYATPEGGLGLMQYDELDIMRMEKRLLKQNNAYS